MIAPVIQDFFNSNISDYLDRLKQGTLIFDDIRDLLARQFNRLSDLEKGIMYWLAINREPISLAELQEGFVQKVSYSELIEGLVSLTRRSLIENKSGKLIQQPIVMEYVTEQFINQIHHEIETEEFTLLISHALVKAQAWNDIRKSQICFILEPIAGRLNAHFRSRKDIERKLSQILGKLRFSNLSGYGGGNIVNLLCQLMIDLTGYDFSRLCIWQAYLRDINLRQVNFTSADLTKSIFAEPSNRTISVTFSLDGRLLTTGNAAGKIYSW